MLSVDHSLTICFAFGCNWPFLCISDGSSASVCVCVSFFIFINMISVDIGIWCARFEQCVQLSQCMIVLFYNLYFCLILSICRILRISSCGCRFFFFERLHFESRSNEKKMQVLSCISLEVIVVLLRKIKDYPWKIACLLFISNIFFPLNIVHFILANLILGHIFEAHTCIFAICQLSWS